MCIPCSALLENGIIFLPTSLLTVPINRSIYALRFGDFAGNTLASQSIEPKIFLNSLVKLGSLKVGSVEWERLEYKKGWNPDLNDGVRMNIHTFMAVLDVKKKDPCVLKDKPNIKWGKDRGKDVESAPWFHKFGGDRINDHHLTLEEKK